MKIITTALTDLLIIEPRIFSDERGFFLESWSAQHFANAGLSVNFVQDNHSRSARGVLRGMHYQVNEPQGKLVRVVSGSAFDVAVDLRQSSSTFGKWAGVLLSAENKAMFWVPPGFAHGFLSLEDDTDFLYKCTAAYDPTDEHALLWDDPSVGIDWPLNGIVPRLSSKDQAGIPLIRAKTYA